MIPLLQGPLTNPHATLITLFMNAVDETRFLDGEEDSPLSTQDLTSKRVRAYVSASLPALTPNSPIIFKVMSARDRVKCHDSTFDR